MDSHPFGNLSVLVSAARLSAGRSTVLRQGPNPEARSGPFWRKAHRGRFGWGVVLTAFFLASATAWGENLPRRIHPWGNFEPGAWKVLRATTESFDKDWVAGSVTETRFTLESVSDSGVSIRVEVLVEMAGKRFRTEPHLVKQGWHGEPVGENIQVRDLGTAEIVIEGRPINCQVVHIENLLPGGRTETKLWYSPTVPPYVLRREMTMTDRATGQLLEKTLSEVTVLEVPCRVGRQVLSTSQIRATHEFARGTITTLSLVSAEVPGGLIGQTAREVDKEGKLIRRTTVELVDFGLQPRLRHPGGLRWHLSTRRIYQLPEDWIRPGLLPELQGFVWPSREKASP